MAVPLLEVNIPPSTSTVDVSIIDTGASFNGKLPTSAFFKPTIVGNEFMPDAIYSFLIEHPTLKRSLVFDLGLRKDWDNLAADFLKPLQAGGVTVHVPKSVREILDEGGVDTKSIEAIIWSHPHLDHTGDPTAFDPNTKLIVGPGIKESLFPGYPTNPQASFLETDVEGREVQELDFSKLPLKIGNFNAIDYFGDGSFYFLDSPGHAIGHVCALARVTSNPDSFILLGGDVVHNNGELRPSQWQPLPDAVVPNPFTRSELPCLGDLFEKILRQGRDQPIYVPADDGPFPVHFDVEGTIESIKKTQELDASDNILVVPAHDHTLLRIANFFPERANDFVKQGWVRQARWAFLRDFAKAVGYEGEIES